MSKQPPSSGHYRSEIDPITYMKANYSFEEVKGFLKGNVLKYLTRHDRKGSSVEDLEKAVWYMAELLEWVKLHKQ